MDIRCMDERDGEIELNSVTNRPFSRRVEFLQMRVLRSCRLRWRDLPCWVKAEELRSSLIVVVGGEKRKCWSTVGRVDKKLCSVERKIICWAIACGVFAEPVALFRHSIAMASTGKPTPSQLVVVGSANADIYVELSGCRRRARLCLQA
ncbi:unnamed protein product [Calypogeia fissa]